MKKSILLIIGSVILTAVLILVATNLSKEGGKTTDPQTADTVFQGEEIPLLEATHIQNGSKAEYNSNPPTSGNHWSEPAQLGVYNGELPDEQLVHNLEHGAIWISYKDSDAETIDKLAGIARRYPQAVIMSPRQGNDTPVALASWGRLLKLETFDEQKIVAFIQSNVNNSPEQFSSLEQLAIDVGNPFPDFSLTEVDGTVVTNTSLLGKPVIMWFTTEFCVPCQIGAKEVAKLDNELGGNAFNVLVVFVDPRETKEDLISWRNRFANDDWMVAFDNFNDGSESLSARVGLKYLDSKYLLDKDGIIQNVDFQIADEKYLGIIRGLVGNL